MSSRLVLLAVALSTCAAVGLSGGGQYADFPSLTAALEASAQWESAVIHLGTSSTYFELLSDFQVDNSLEIRGHGQKLVARATLVVNSRLEVYEVVLVAELLAYFFQVNGALRLDKLETEHSTSSQGLVLLAEGILTISESKLVGLSIVSITGQNCTVDIASSTVSASRGLVTSNINHVEGKTAINIDKVTVTDSPSSLLVFSASSDYHFALHITNSDFHSNTGHIVHTELQSPSGYRLSLAVSNCTFYSNPLVLYAGIEAAVANYELSVELAACSFAAQARVVLVTAHSSLANSRLAISTRDSTFTSISTALEFSVYGALRPANNLFSLDVTHCTVASVEFFVFMTMNGVVEPAANQHFLKVLNSAFDSNSRLVYIDTPAVSQSSDTLYSVQLSNCSVSASSDFSIYVSQTGLSQTTPAFEVAIDWCSFVRINYYVLSLPPCGTLHISNSTFRDIFPTVFRIEMLSFFADSSLAIEIADSSVFNILHSVFLIAVAEMPQQTRSFVSISATRSLFENSAFFLSFEERGTGPYSGLLHSLKVSNCTFRLTRVHLFHVLTRAVDRPSEQFTPIQVRDCSFQDDIGIIFYLEMDRTSQTSLSQTVLRVANCSFLRTFNTALFFMYLSRPTAVPTLQAKAMIVFDSCAWREVQNYILEAYYMNYGVVFTNSTVDGFNQALVMTAMGVGEEDCDLGVDGLIVRDARSIKINGLLYVEYCTASLRNISVTNFISKAPSDRNALFQFNRAQGEMENIDVIESGSYGYIIFCFLSPLTVRNARILAPYIGGLGVIVGALSDMKLSDLTFSDVMREEVSAGLSFFRPVFVGWSVADIAMTDIVVDKQTYTLNDSGYMAILLASIGTFSLNRAYLDGLRTDSIALLINSTGSIAHLACRNVTFETFAFLMLRDSSLTANDSSFDGITALQNTQAELSRHLRGLALVGSNCALTMLAMRTVNSSFTTLFVLDKASLTLQDVAVKNCSSRTFIEICIDSTANISKATFDAVVIGKILASFSVISLSQCTFHKVYVNSELLQTTRTQITLDTVDFDGLFSTIRLGRVDEKSFMIVSNSVWREVHTLEGEGFLLSSSVLQVEKSAFSQFNFTFFHLTDVQYAISHTSVRDGQVTIISSKSHFAYGAFISCVDCRQGSIRHFYAFNLSALIGGALAFQHSPDTVDSVTIADSKFELCSAKNGGALYFSSVVFSVLDSTFEYNFAASSGGAIEVAGTSTRQLLRDCSFQRNAATAGGAVKWHNSPIALVNATFKGNEADYGPNLASFPLALAAKLTNNSAIASGVSTSFQLFLLDHYGQTVNTANLSTLQLIASDEVDYKGNTAALSNRGVFNFADITIYAKPASIQIVTGVVNDYFEGRKMQIQGTFEIHFRNCSVGEISRADRCELCNEGNVSYSIFDTDCTPCPSNAFCHGGSNMTVDRKYWRSAWNSLVILECPLPDKCLGGPNSTCAREFTGKLCNECASNTYRARVTECVGCSGLVWLQLAGIPLALALFAWAVVEYGERSPDEFKLFVVKCFVSHAQLLSVVAPFRVSYPAAVMNSLRAVAYLSSLGLSDLPIACFGVSSPEYIRAVVGAAVFPLAALGSLPSLLFFAKNSKRAATILLTSLSLFTPAITVQLVVLLLSCISADTSAEWLFVDMSQRCWDKTHLAMIVQVLIPFTIFNCVLPLVAAVVLNLLSAANFKQHFPMWCAGYRLQLWDIPSTASRCVCLWVMLNTISNDTIAQVGYGLANLILLCVVTVSLEEFVYKSALCFFLAETSTVIVAVSLGLGTYYVYYPPGSRVTDYFIAVLFFVLNGGYFIVCFVLIRFKKALRVASLSEKVEDLPEIRNPPNTPEASIEVRRGGATLSSQLGLI